MFEVSVAFEDSEVIDRGSWGDVTATMTVGNGATTQEVTQKITFKANLPKVSLLMKYRH